MNNIVGISFRFFCQLMNDKIIDSQSTSVEIAQAFKVTGNITAVHSYKKQNVTVHRCRQYIYSYLSLTNVFPQNLPRDSRKSVYAS